MKFNLPTISLSKYGHEGGSLRTKSGPTECHLHYIKQRVWLRKVSCLVGIADVHLKHMKPCEIIAKLVSNESQLKSDECIL